MTEGRSHLVSAGLDPAVPAAAGTGRSVVADADEVSARATSRSAFLVLVLRLAAAGCGLAVTVVLTRHLGPTRFGELSLLLSVAIMATAVAELGTTPVVAAEMAGRPARRRELAAGIAVLRTGAGAVLGGGVAVLLALAVDRTAAQWAAVAVAAAIPVAGISALAVLAQARLRPHVGAALSFGQSVAWLAAVAMVAVAGADVDVVGAAFLGSVLAQAAATWLVVARRERPAWGQWRPAAGWILARSWPLAVAGALGTLYYRLDAVLVFGLRGAAEAGVYGAAYRFLDVSQLVPVAIVSVLLPVLGRHWGRGDVAGFEAVVRLGVTAGAAVGALVAAVGLVCADRVAVTVLGAGFAGSGSVLRILAVAAFSLATGYVYAAVAIATGDVKAVGVTSAAALVVAVGAGVPVIATWGAEGAAWVTVGTEFVASTGLGLWIHRRHRLRFPGRRVGASVGAALIAVAVALPLRDLPALVPLVAVVAVYGLAAARLGAVTPADLRAMTHPSLALGAEE